VAGSRRWDVAAAAAASVFDRPEEDVPRLVELR
jgi:hypothetical protein